MDGFNPVREGKYYSYIFSSFTNLLTPKSICTANPNRVSLIISNNLNKFLCLTQNPDIFIAGSPIMLIPNGENLVLDWDTVGGLVTLQWWVSQNQAANNAVNTSGTIVYVTEVIYTPIQE
jgi:hypothetical protein